MQSWMLMRMQTSLKSQDANSRHYLRIPGLRAPVKVFYDVDVLFSRIVNPILCI